MDVIGVIGTKVHSHLHRVHIKWQCPISGVHSIMMEKSALACEGGGSRPPPFTLFTLIYKVADAPAQRADHLYPICTLWSSQQIGFTTLSKNGIKLVCNLNIVYGNLKSENSQDYAQKQQRNCPFMHWALGIDKQKKKRKKSCERMLQIRLDWEYSSRTNTNRGLSRIPPALLHN